MSIAVCTYCGTVKGALDWSQKMRIQAPLPRRTGSLTFTLSLSLSGLQLYDAVRCSLTIYQHVFHLNSHVLVTIFCLWCFICMLFSYWTELIFDWEEHNLGVDCDEQMTWVYLSSSVLVLWRMYKRSNNTTSELLKTTIMPYVND